MVSTFKWSPEQKTLQQVQIALLPKTSDVADTNDTQSVYQ